MDESSDTDMLTEMVKSRMFLEFQILPPRTVCQTGKVWTIESNGTSCSYTLEQKDEEVVYIYCQVRVVVFYYILFLALQQTSCNNDKFLYVIKLYCAPAAPV